MFENSSDSENCKWSRNTRILENFEENGVFSGTRKSFHKELVSEDESTSESENEHEVVTVYRFVKPNSEGTEEGGTNRVIVSDSEPDLVEEISDSDQNCPSREVISEHAPILEPDQDVTNFRRPQYSPRTEISAQLQVHDDPDASEESCCSPERSIHQKSELSDDESDYSDMGGDSWDLREEKDPLAEVEGENQEESDPGDAELASGDVTDELEFTLDHFGQDTTLAEAANNDLGNFEKVPPSAASSVPPLCASTANRDREQAPSYLDRKSRLNRGVPRTRLDL